MLTILGFVVSLEQRYEIHNMVICILADMSESEEFHDAPKPSKVGRATEDDQGPAPTQKEGQAPEIGIDVVLIDTDFVEPNLRLTFIMAFDKVSSPMLQSCPLCLSIVEPRMRNEGITRSQLGRDAFREEFGTWVVVQDIVECDVSHENFPKSFLCFAERTTHGTSTDKASYSSSSLLLAVSQEYLVESPLGTLPDSGSCYKTQHHRLEEDNPPPSHEGVAKDREVHCSRQLEWKGECHPNSDCSPHQRLHRNGSPHSHGQDGTDHEERCVDHTPNQTQHHEGFEVVQRPQLRELNFGAHHYNHVQNDHGPHDSEVVGQGGQAEAYKTDEVECSQQPKCCMTFPGGFTWWTPGGEIIGLGISQRPID
mmetsp:Transcript_75730/g.157841  ORF Transcript_75730/g.157841 Transcript_75730/m.157841 type:complete len:367 (+) Transcript_75730:746-1846(+)